MNAVATRNKFRPPCYHVYRLGAGNPPIPLMTDLRGERISKRATIWLAYDDEHLYLDARIQECKLTLRPDLPVDSPDFWTQDHIEFRYLRGEEQVQFIATPDSRVWKNAAKAEAKRYRDGWWVRLTIPVHPTGAWRGIVAHTRWGDGFPDIVCSSATELGFSQVERFGKFRFCRGPGQPVRLPAKLTCSFPAFTHLKLKGGAITFRAPLPPARVPKLKHPYLLDLDGMRAKLKHEPFASADVPPAPVTEITESLEITEGCMNWFRVAKESMVGGKTPATRYIWSRQSPAAQEAWRGIVKSVKPTEKQLGVLIPELNRLLARPDFYNTEAFAQVRLPEDAKHCREDVFRFNRIALQSAVECIHNFQMELTMRPGQCFERWLATGERALIAQATESVRAALRLTILSHEVHLHEGMAAGNLAFAYDAFYPHLSVADRQAWRQLLARFLRLYLHTARRRSWTVTTIANANPVGNGGCGLAALALWRDEPKLAREALQWARENIWYWLDYCNGPDGGNTEGAQYWQYGMENFLRFAAALKRVAGSDDGMLTHPAVRNCLNMIRVGLTNDGALHGINDTVPTPIGGNIAWYAGSQLGLWYGDHAWNAKAPVCRPRLFDMLAYRPVAKTPAAPRFPVVLALHSIEYGILRSEPRWDAKLVAGIKGSRPPYTHHNQLDTGAFFLDVAGERMLIDPGYYKAQPTDHCLPLINGRGPARPNEYTGKIIACRAGYLACDVTKAYGGVAQRVIRHLLLLDNDAVVLLDDIVADGLVTAQYQSGGVTESLPGGFRIRGEKVTLNVHVFGADAVKLLPERSLHDTHWGYHFATCRLFPVTASYRALATQPLVSVFGEPSVSPRVYRNSGRIRVDLGARRKVEFVCQKDRWCLT